MLAVVVLISCLVSGAASVKCYQCSSNEDNCNSGDCEGDWCVARYITKNPFANDQEQRVTKSCEKAHPNGYNNDSCVESLSPSGRKLSCGCQKDYCNDEKAIQKLPVEYDSSSGGDLVNHTNSGSLKCVCNEDQNCINNECRGAACTTEVYDETGLLSAGGGVRLGARISKGCAAFIPGDVNNNQITKPTVVTLPNGKPADTKVTIFYCNDRDYCNSRGAPSRAILSLFVFVVSACVMFVSA